MLGVRSQPDLRLERMLIFLSHHFVQHDQEIYRSVSKEDLHRCLSQVDFIWNNRFLNNGERTVAAIRSAEGKRLMYEQSAVS